MSTPFSQTNYHHSTACHCSCHHAQPSQSTQSQPTQPNVPGQTEISQLFNGIQEYFRSLYTPPQVRVTRSGFWSTQSMAFGRQGLAKMSYDEAETLFRSIFESEGDKIQVPPDEKSNGREQEVKVLPSIMEIHATFLREPRGSTEASVVLHRSAWPEVMENVKGLSVVFRKGKVDESNKL